MNNNIENLPGEIWKDIERYEGLYAISNLGRVKSFDKIIPRKNGTTYFLKGRVMKQNLVGPIGKKYLCVDLFKDGVRRSSKVHRLVAKAFIDNPENYPCINHKNEDKEDNRVDNLEWCSYSYNNTYNGLSWRRNRKRNHNRTL